MGSSASSSAGSVTSARATATRCCWPPESWSGLLRRRSPRPTSHEPLLGTLVGLGGWDTVERERQRGVLGGVEHRNQVEELEHEAEAATSQHGELVVGHARDGHPVDLDLTFGWRVQPAEQVEQGGLAAAAGTHDGDELAGVHSEVDVIERDDLGGTAAVDLGQTLGLDDRHATVSSSYPVAL